MVVTTFPRLCRYEQTNMNDNPVLYSEAPWLRGEYVNFVKMWLPYVGADRYFPGDVPERALGSFKWRQRVTIPLNGLATPLRQ